PLATDCMAWLTEEPGDAILKGEFLGAAGLGASSWAVCCGAGCSAGGAGGACCAVWAGGCGAGLGPPGLRDASSSLRSVSLSGEGVFELARRSLSEIMLVLGGVFGFDRSSGMTIIVVSGLALSGTMTAWFLVHLGTSSRSAMMTPCVAREI